MSRLVLINGAPGSGKSTLAEALAAGQSAWFALDIDAVKHGLAEWHADQARAGTKARRLAVALIRKELDDGRSVVVGQFLARPDFIDELATVATEHGAAFVEIVLRVDAATLAERLRQRAARPERPEHRVNRALVSPADAPRLVEVMEALVATRPEAVVVEASGTVEQSVQRVRGAVGVGDPRPDDLPPEQATSPQL